MRSPRATAIESSAFRPTLQYGVAVAVPSPSSLQLRFTATWNGAPLIGVSRVSGLRRTVDVVEYRESTASGDSATTKLPGDVTFEPVTLERAVTGDGAFATIADAAASPGPGAGHRGTLIVSLHDQTGRLVLSSTLHRAWVTAYDAFAGLDAHADEPVVERVTFVYESWQLTHAPPP
jgi:phage tail-like protein